jgi:hypothetical protein
MPRAIIISCLAFLLTLVGCAQSRAQQLRSKSDRVASQLQGEQRRVLALTGESTRQARLDHLTQLRATLSAANIGLGTVPYLLQEPERPVAYDVLDEVYETIAWNIPLGPDQPQKSLPSAFAGGTLNLNNAVPPRK